MPLQIPQRFQPQIQSALEKAVNDAKLFPAPEHRGYEPEGINAPWFRSLYDRPTPIPGVNLGDVIPPMAAAEGMTRASESLGMGNYGQAGIEGGLAMLDAIDPSPVAWGAMGSGIGATVWHGSPHRWDKPDLSKVGTGEGAQAYGHGFYSAENKRVGQQYKESLSGGAREMLDSTFSNDPELWVAAQKYSGGSDADIRDGLGILGYDGDVERLLSSADTRLAAQLDKGHLYKLDIDDSVVGRMLDWDAPLSEQTKEIQNLIDSGDIQGAVRPKGVSVVDNNGDYFLQSPSGLAMPNQYSDLAKATAEATRINDKMYPMPKLIGEDIHDQLVESYRKAGALNPQEMASKELASLGIPGIKYWDGSSRLGGKGTRNFVNFNADDITAISRNGEPIRRNDLFK